VAEDRVLIVIDDDNVMRIALEPAIELIAPPEDIELRQVGSIREQFVHPVDDVLGPMPQHGIREGFEEEVHDARIIGK